MQDMRINGPALRVIRERSGMTITRLAEATGIDRSHLSHIEAGRVQASPENVLTIARALKVELPAILAEAAEAAS